MLSFLWHCALPPHPSFHLLLLFLSRSPAQTWVEARGALSCPRGSQEGSRQQKTQDSCQGQRRSWASSRPARPHTISGFSQMFVPWPACSQPCPGQPCTNLRKRKVNRPQKRCGCSCLRQQSPVWPTNCTHSTNSVLWASDATWACQMRTKGLAVQTKRDTARKALGKGLAHRMRKVELGQTHNQAHFLSRTALCLGRSAPSWLLFSAQRCQNLVQSHKKS